MRLSRAAQELIVYVYERGGQAPASFDAGTVHEVVRAGMVEAVSLGVPDPLLVLTRAGRDHGRHLTLPSNDPAR